MHPCGKASFFKSLSSFAIRLADIACGPLGGIVVLNQEAAGGVGSCSGRLDSGLRMRASSSSLQLRRSVRSVRGGVSKTSARTLRGG